MTEGFDMIGKRHELPNGMHAISKRVFGEWELEFHRADGSYLEQAGPFDSAEDALEELQKVESRIIEAAAQDESSEVYEQKQERRRDFRAVMEDAVENYFRQGHFSNLRMYQTDAEGNDVMQSYLHVHCSLPLNPDAVKRSIKIGPKEVSALFSKRHEDGSLTNWSVHAHADVTDILVRYIAN